MTTPEVLPDTLPVILLNVLEDARVRRQGPERPNTVQAPLCPGSHTHPVTCPRPPALEAMTCPSGALRTAPPPGAPRRSLSTCLPPASPAGEWVEGTGPSHRLASDLRLLCPWLVLLGTARRPCAPLSGHRTDELLAGPPLSRVLKPSSPRISTVASGLWRVGYQEPLPGY